MANILSFTVKNFRSYKDEVSFTFEAIDSEARRGNYHDVRLKNDSHCRLLNSAVVYGPNAAGKSTIIIALWALVSFVKTSRENDPSFRLPYEPYMLSKKTENAPIMMALELIVDSHIYIYKISYNRNGFIDEILTNATSNTVIFHKDENGYVEFNRTLLCQFKNTYFLKNHLALSKLSLEANTLVQSIYKEITSIITIPLLENQNIWGNVQTIASHIYEEPESIFSKMITDLIVMSDTQIVDLNVEKNNLQLPESWSDSQKRQFKEQYGYEVKMVHRTEDGENIGFPLNAESAGTKTLFTAGARVIEALEKGGFLAYDEMNIALHPKLFKRLVELFHNKKTNPNNAQLLITTHDATLMEDNFMRADQIWFVEKENGASNVYSAIDFENISIDQPFEAWYRTGRLGARPNIKPFYY